MGADAVSLPCADVCPPPAAPRELVRIGEAIAAWRSAPSCTERAAAVRAHTRAAPSATVAAGLADAVVCAIDETETRTIVRELDAESYATLRRELIDRGISSQRFASWFGAPCSWRWDSDGEDEAQRALQEVYSMEGGEECVREMEMMIGNALCEIHGLDPSLDTVGLYLTP